MKLKIIQHRGQVLVFYALMIPLFILVLGVGLDLGWYYLNVSRLQNAADAAAVAGAYRLLESNKFSGYQDVVVVNVTITILFASSVFKRRVCDCR